MLACDEIQQVGRARYTTELEMNILAPCSPQHTPNTPNHFCWCFHVSDYQNDTNMAKYEDMNVIDDQIKQSI